MKRNFAETPATMGVLVSRLDQQIERHAEYRLRHYCFYAFCLYALVSRLAREKTPLQNEADIPLDFDRYLVLKATHQIGAGYRKTEEEFSDFIRDASVLNLPVNAFKNIDAAHTCGLGASHLLDGRVNQSKDPHVRDLYNGLLAVMRTTAQLPQLVNVGPDKIIDSVHAKRIRQHLNGASIANPLLSEGELFNYIGEARLAINVYIAAKNHQNRPGLAACAEAYLNFYNNTRKVDSVINDIRYAMRDECRDYEINRQKIIG